MTALCTHKFSFGQDQAAVTRCSGLTSQSSCDTDSASACEWKKANICFQGVQWKKVKSLPSTSPSWYSSTDNLQGTDVTGDPNNDSAEWSVAFSNDNHDKFLFASSDFTIWAQALKTEVGPGGNYNTNPPRNVINSSSSKTAYTSDWKNRNMCGRGGPCIYLN